MYEIYKKLFNARDIIKNTKVKKEGHNKLSGYEYFTPSQISLLVHEACKECGLIHIYRLEKSDLGYTARLTLLDLDRPESGINFEIPTSIPDIKATNEAQKLGGAVTYSERYLLMITFDIVDNSLDFDTTENTKKASEKELKTIGVKALTPKFFDNWNGEIDNNNIVTLKGIQYQLDNEANKALRDYIDSEIDKLQNHD